MRSRARDFEADPHPGNPRILFVGLPQSSHTHGWIDLLAESDLNVRLFAVPVVQEVNHRMRVVQPPEKWPTKVYVFGEDQQQNTETRRYWYSGARGGFRRRQHQLRRKLGRAVPDAGAWLADTIRTWRPDVIHTLGLFDGQGGEFYLSARRNHHLDGLGLWVLQLRGGSDLELRRFEPEARMVISEAVAACDQIVCDNRANVAILRGFGVEAGKIAPIVPIPGSGGIDCGDVAPLEQPSRRERLVVWPKAYESPWSKALPVLEAIRIAWDSIQPCEFHFLATAPEVRAWYWTLPPSMRDRFHLAERIPRSEVLALMRRARVMLAPSLIDGIPNSLYEAMAYGAFPIVSPLDTVRSLPVDESNVLFGRNLYPQEIADALCRALTDDELVDRAAMVNRELVRGVADRSVLRPRLVNYYRALARSRRARRLD